MMKHSPIVVALSAATLGLATGAAHGAGFQLLEQNASGLGNAYAGSAAVAENASTIYFNPAGMAYLPGLSVSGGVNAIKPSFKFKDDGNSTRPLAAPGALGGNGGDAGKWGVVPNAYLAWQIDNRWNIGVGLGAPFGLMTHYQGDWVGQYHSRKFEIQTINVNPSVSYKVNEQWALGVGVNYQRIDAEYTRTAVVAPGLSRDATVKMDGDAWGWNAGVMFQPTPATRIGLSYRSKVKHDVDGHTDLAGIGSFDAQANVDLPDSAILSAYHQLNSRWELLGDVSWTGWSSIPELKINNTGIPGDTLHLDFRDTWRVALGANYKVNESWKLKFGVAWDQSPVHEAADRPTSLPDNDRWWFSTGVQFQAGKNTTVDLGYTYLYLDKTRINNTGESLAQKGRVSGEYTSNGNIFGVQVSSRF
ncbi:Long-chain fatty acid transport protein [plant metagenome]|uniref:Long-chain fatty acid transport protein n=1 Tax=plant metagenome TaxID=1297885 RepID=A0A484YCN5_9ZZZZ